MYTKKEINDILKKEYADRAVWVETKGYVLTINPNRRNRCKSRREWADDVAQKSFGVSRETIIKKFPFSHSSGEYSFSYIKFAIDSNGEIFGIVSGKSSFHKYYPSDVWFYDIEKGKNKAAAIEMKNSGWTWDTEEILILKNENPKNSREAYENEKILKDLFGLYD